MPSPLSLAVGYYRIVTHGRRLCNNVVATDLAGVLRGSGPYNVLGRAGAPTLARSSHCTLEALRRIIIGANIPIPGGASTPPKACYNFPRARRIGFYHGSELQPPALRFAPLPYRRVVRLYTRAMSLPSLYIRNIMPTDTSIPLLEYLALSGWG
jgi:hypothetical protein